MSALLAKRASPRIGRAGSRTDSPLDPNNPLLKLDAGQEIDRASKAVTDADASQAIAAAARRQGPTEAETDYFSGVHSTNHFSLEPNPFEQSFGNSNIDTPGKSLLPPVASLTSPSLPGVSAAGGFTWPNSLRAGPLSPAMLAGPSGSADFLDSIGRGFPTPNESSLRTGLTPGGGGSMFPVPSPGLLQQLQSGGATPSTIEFQRTAINAAKRNGAPTSNPQEADLLHQATTIDITKNGAPLDPFSHPDATDAANGLYMLAKGGQSEGLGYPQNMQQVQDPLNGFSGNNSPLNSALGLMRHDDMVEPHLNGGEMSDEPTGQAKANGRKSKRAAKSSNTTTGRRKADDSKAIGSNKKAKVSIGSIDRSTDDDAKLSGSEAIPSGSKKMTDDEKRKNFLERNRVAALKCRQRKKQWLANLQSKVEFYSQENDTLSSTVTKLREEIVTLKSLLLAHKDCPVTQAQGLNGLMMNGMPNEFMAPPPGPFGIPMQHAPPGLSAQPMPRR